MTHSTHSTYPIALDLHGKRCLVVGGGEIADGKLDVLLAAGAELTVVSPQVRPRIAALAAAGQLQLRQRPFRGSDLAGAFLVIAATDDRPLNARIAGQARHVGALVNAVDDPPNCDFFAVALVRRGDLQVAISTNGRSPAFARWLRERLEGQLSPEYGDLLDVLGEVRQTLRQRGPIPVYEHWRDAIDAAVLEALRRGDRRAAHDRVLGRLSGDAGEAAAASPDPQSLSAATGTRLGRVAIVGAGPGAPGLITVAGLERLRAAEVLVYDRLVHPALIDEAPPGCERVDAGKRAGQPGPDQRAIERLLIERARQGKQVVRLKGGDPFVFGRGGEEVAALVAAGVSVEVVPGVSSAVAAPAAAGIPVTHRELASAFTVVTAHEDPTKPETSVDWSWLARASGTLVILMGLARVEAICLRLIAEGMAPETPAAIVSAGTLPEQRVVEGSLLTLPSLAVEAVLRSPALIVVGDVVRFRRRHAGLDPDRLDWRGIENVIFESEPALVAPRLGQQGALQ